MAAFFSATLALSIVGLVTLLVLKHYELSSGRVVMGSLRPKIGHFFHKLLMLFERGVPRLARVVVRRAARAARERAKQALARAILFFEATLEWVLHVVRQKSDAPQGKGATSQFLQEVAAHKQKLLRRTPRKRMIVEE